MDMKDQDRDTRVALWATFLREAQQLGTPPEAVAEMIVRALEEAAGGIAG
jgi:hypothetical protein